MRTSVKGNISSPSHVGEGWGGVLLLVLFSLMGFNVWAEGGKSQIPLADPYILLDDGKYYAYGTNDANGIRCYTSDDLRVWTYEGLALHKDNCTEDRWFWAPEVYHVGDKYIMYFSANEHLFAAVGDSPKGPFKQVGGYQMESVIGSEKCIDSSVFFDDDGKAYIFFVRFNDGNCIWRAQLQDDYITPVAGTLKKCIAVSQSWENILGRVCEGPNVVKYNKRYFLTYSANDYQSQDYAVGYATATSITATSWNKYGNPILKRWDDLVGTGHHSIFTDKEGKLRIVFHAHNSTTQIHSRLMYIGTLQFSGTRLQMTQEPIIRPTLNQSAPYNPELISKTWGFERGGAVTVDLNNDGYQDIVAGGSSNEATNSATDAFTRNRKMHLSLFLPSTRKWSNVSTEAPFQVADAPSLIPCDLNNDGNMDIIAFEEVGTDVTHEAYTGNYGREGIFLGKGDGTFGVCDIDFDADFDSDLDTPPYGGGAGGEAAFDFRGVCAADVIDIDNDGRLDIVCAGFQGEKSYNVILHNKGFDAEGKLHLSVEPYEKEFRLKEAIVQVADFNNDGLQDFIISAGVDGREGQIRFTDIYLNDSQKPGRFTRQMLGEKDGEIKRKSNGALLVADFNNDGWMDIMLSGNGESSSGETASRQRIYLNRQQQDKPSFSPANNEFMADIYSQQTSVNNSAGVIDWDGDGYYDILLGGIKTGANSSTGQLYLNDGQGRMTRSVLIPGASAPAVIFPDWDGNGRKDYVVTGLCTDANYLTDEQKGRNIILCYNLNPTPARPDAPTACTVEQNGGLVTLAWEAAESTKPCCTYELYIKDSEGNLINSVPAFVGGDNDGVRKVSRTGRAGCLHHWTFRPTAAGTYTWGVQTVNAAYDGSPFAEGPSFTVNASDVGSSIALPQDTAPRQHIYSVDGTQQPRVRRGVNIIQTAEGARKIIF